MNSKLNNALRNPESFNESEFGMIVTRDFPLLDSWTVRTHTGRGVGWIKKVYGKLVGGCYTPQQVREARDRRRELQEGYLERRLQVAQMVCAGVPVVHAQGQQGGTLSLPASLGVSARGVFKLIHGRNPVDELELEEFAAEAANPQSMLQSMRGMRRMPQWRRDYAAA